MLKLFTTIFLIIALFSGLQCRISENELSEKLQNLAKQIREKCIKRSEISPSSIGKLQEGDFTDAEKGRAYVYCMWNESNSVDADGKINYEVIDGNFPPEQKSIVELIKECEAAHSSEKDAANKIWEMTKCFHATDPKRYIML